MRVTKFGRLEVSKGDTDDPRDVNVDIIDFEFDEELSNEHTWEPVFAILEYIKQAFQVD